jgi:hypothetical protein
VIHDEFLRALLIWIHTLLPLWAQSVLLPISRTQGRFASRLAVSILEEHILRPRKTVIKTDNVIEPNHFVHFDVDTPSKQESTRLQNLEGLDAAQIWLSLDDDSIEEMIEKYTFMSNQQVCKEEYASFARERFLK